MLKYENECVGCPTEMGCMGSSCPNRNVPHLYCDCCEREVYKLYWFNDEEFCIDCVKDNIEDILEEVKYE